MFLGPGCPVRTVSKLLSFFARPQWPGRKVTVSLQSPSGSFFHCIFLFLLTPLLTCLTSFFFFFFSLVSLNSVPSLSLSILGFHLHVPLPYSFLCLFCGMVQEKNFDSLRSPSRMESQNHPGLSFSCSSDFCKVKDALL